MKKVELNTRYMIGEEDSLSMIFQFSVETTFGEIWLNVRVILISFWVFISCWSASPLNKFGAQGHCNKKALTTKALAYSYLIIPISD